MLKKEPKFIGRSNNDIFKKQGHKLSRKDKNLKKLELHIQLCDPKDIVKA